MKKFAITLLVFIVILGIVLLLKINGVIMPSSKENKTANISTASAYSNEDIKTLILKGKDNLNNMQNIYYEWGLKQSLAKVYYKGDKMKDDLYHPLYPNEKIQSTIVIDGKEYYIDHREKIMRVSKANPIELEYGFQTAIIRLAKSSLYEFTYLRDEKLDEKDCILVKAIYHGAEYYTTELIKKKGDEVFWLEKSTGFMIGDGRIKQNEETPTLEVLYRNISLGTVKDNDFEIPTGYKTE